MKNKLLAILVSIVLFLPVSVQADDSTTFSETNVPVTNSIDEDNDVIDSQYKQPISKRKIAKKFLLAMGGVAVSSFSIFFLLTIYNRLREGFIAPINTPDGETSLETPDDLNAAVRTFLEKTNWNK